MSDYPGAVDMFVDESRVFINSLVNKTNQFAIVIHKTACDSTCSAQSQGEYFQTNSEEKSAHYIIGKDGTVVQCVLEKDGAGANCCLENGYDVFWDSAPTKSNLNMCTYSIEHCDYSNDNSDVLTDAEKSSSFKLVAYLCHKYSIGLDHIKGHSSISPISKPDCPNNYPWSELFAYLKNEGVMVPAGWNDNPTEDKLTSPNGHYAKLGMRQFILNNDWDAEDELLTEETYVQSVEESNLSLGPGSYLVSRMHRLEYTETKGVFYGWLGQEYLYVKSNRDNTNLIVAQLQAQIKALQNGLPTADMTSVITAIDKLSADLKALKQ